MSGSVNWENVNDRVSRLSVTERSRDGMVQVTVSASGVLTNLVLREHRHQPQPLTAVAAQIMDCLRRAQAKIPDLLQQTMFEVIGPDDPAAHLVVADARKRFPEPEPRSDRQPDPAAPRADPPATPPAPRQSGHPERADDEWDERPIMEDVV